MKLARIENEVGGKGFRHIKFLGTKVKVQDLYLNNGNKSVQCARHLSAAVNTWLPGLKFTTQANSNGDCSGAPLWQKKAVSTVHSLILVKSRTRKN